MPISRNTGFAFCTPAAPGAAPPLCYEAHRRRSGTQARPSLRVPHLVMSEAHLCWAPACPGQAMLLLRLLGSRMALSAYPQGP